MDVRTYEHEYVIVCGSYKVEERVKSCLVCCDLHTSSFPYSKLNEMLSKKMLFFIDTISNK